MPGTTIPRGMQRLLSAAVWDEDGVRNDLRGYVTERLARAYHFKRRAEQIP